MTREYSNWANQGPRPQNRATKLLVKSRYAGLCRRSISSTKCLLLHNRDQTENIAFSSTLSVGVISVCQGFLFGQLTWSPIDVPICRNFGPEAT